MHTFVVLMNASWKSSVVLKGLFVLAIIWGQAIKAEAAGTLGDLNGDGVVNITDLMLVSANFGKTTGDPDLDGRADANSDGAVNNTDLMIVIANFAREGDTNLTISVDKENVTVGEAVTVTMNLADAAAFASWQEWLGFNGDNRLLKLEQQNGGSWPTFVPDSRSLQTINQTDEIRAGGFSLTNNEGGSGTLGSFTFRVESSLPAAATVPVPVKITTENYSASNLFGNRFSDTGGTDFVPTVGGGELVINVWPHNTAPVVAAGEDKTIRLPNSITLMGAVSDDGLPTPPALVTKQWSKVSGPGTVTFGSGDKTTTTATFSTDGTYVLRLTANDGALNTTDEVTISVQPAPEVYFVAPDVVYVEIGSNAAIPITVRGRNVDLTSLLFNFITDSPQVFTDSIFE